MSFDKCIHRVTPVPVKIQNCVVQYGSHYPHLAVEHAASVNKEPYFKFHLILIKI